MEHDYRNQKNGLSDSYGYLGKCRTEYARFLKQEDFLYYKEHLPAYFQYVALYGCEQDGRLVGFIGVAENNIEMLFIHNDYRKKGIGKKLVMYAIKKLQVYKVDVNEQNIQAVGFTSIWDFRL